jgi:Fe-S cluster assembly protein SufD
MEESLDGSRYELDSPQVEGLQVAWVSAGEALRGVAGISEDRLAANAWSQTQEVLTITIEGTHTEPLRFHRGHMGSGLRAAHTIIRLAQGAQAALILSSTGDAALGENVEFDLGEGSSFHAVFVGEWNSGAIHYGAHFATLAKKAALTHIVVNLGGDIVILNPSVHLVGEGSEAHLFGGYFADASQHLEHRVYVHHVGPSTTSRVAYKGALHGRGARTVWVGDVLIGADAKGTDSYEQNRNLVLSEGTRADSVPNLEIKTGDIKGAGHASATGRFDDEQLFYLQSRGIEELEARRLVVLGFLIDIISKIEDPALVEELTTTVRAKLSATEVAA